MRNSILALEAANAHAYRSGYQSAYTDYQQLSARYVAELRKPKITLGRSIGLIAAARAGFLVALVTQ